MLPVPILLVVMGSFSPSAITQDSWARLYTRSLAACIQAKQGKISNLGVVVVIKNAITDDPALIYPRPQKIEAVTLEYLDGKSLVKRFRQNGREFQAIAIKPMINRREEVTVDCEDYIVSVRRRKLVLSVAGGTTVRWRFDLSSSDYVMTKIEPWRFGM